MSTVAGTVSIEDAYQEVSVVASDAVASEVTLNPGAFTFTRVGQREPCADGQLHRRRIRDARSWTTRRWPPRVVIPASAASITVAVTPLADTEEEALETVLVDAGERRLRRRGADQRDREPRTTIRSRASR